MTRHNECIIREVLDTLYEAKGAILGLTALDTELEMQIKIRDNECATSRRIDRAITAIQQLEEPNPWHKASEELPKEHAPSIIAFKFKGEWIYDVGYLVKDEWNSNLLESYDVVEYWMPIPELPKED